MSYTKDPRVNDYIERLPEWQHLTGRAIAIRQGGTINSKALLAMIREIIEHNRAGGWRKLKS